MAQQTAIMQLINFILVERRQEDGSIKFHAHEDFSRFLQMEKEQQFRFFIAGQLSMEEGGKDFEQYYNETYKKMKLYTEEQLVRAMTIAVYNKYEKYMEVLELLTPIELPSDEEIEQGLFHQSNEYSYGYKDAFQWMKEQILNQNK